MPPHPSSMSSKSRRRWNLACCGQAQFQHMDELSIKNLHLKQQLTEEIYVRATGSDGVTTPSPTGTQVSSSVGSGDDDWEDATVWFDCEEAFTCDGSPGAEPDCANSSTSTELEVAINALPTELATIVRRYKQGCTMGCKPTVALIKYMESTDVTYDQLCQQLAAVLAAEDASADIPTPTPQMAPQERTKLLQGAGSQTSTCSNGGSRTQQQQGIPSVARLLSNVLLVQDTLSGMAHKEEFKQVAWGKLELWYMHDHNHHRQVIKARTILDEPVVNTVCLAREVDLVTSWNPAMSDARELASYSASELLVYMLCWAPWPLPCPEIINYGLGVDLLDTKANCVLVATLGKSELPEGLTLPSHPRVVHLTMDAGGFRFVPLPPDPARPSVQRMEATVLISIDAKGFVVPDAVISFILRVFAPLVYKSVLKVLAKLFHPDVSKRPHGEGEEPAAHSQLLQRLHCRREYAAIDEHAKQYLKHKQQHVGSF